jgi:hypothetical protein
MALKSSMHHLGLLNVSHLATCKHNPHAELFDVFPANYISIVANTAIGLFHIISINVLIE